MARRRPHSDRRTDLVPEDPPAETTDKAPAAPCRLHWLDARRGILASAADWLLAEAGAHARREHPHLDDRALVLAEPHVFAGAVGTRVHQDQPARRLPDDAGRADRDHHAEQHRKALERVGARPGDVGVGHRHREDREAHQERPARTAQPQGADLL